MFDIGFSVPYFYETIFVDLFTFFIFESLDSVCLAACLSLCVSLLLCVYVQPHTLARAHVCASLLWYFWQRKILVMLSHGTTVIGRRTPERPRLIARTMRGIGKSLPRLPRVLCCCSLLSAGSAKARPGLAGQERSPET